MIYHRFLEMLNEDCFDNVMIELYGSSAETIARQKKRYAYALEKEEKRACLYSVRLLGSVIPIQA